MAFISVSKTGALVASPSQTVGRRKWKWRANSFLVQGDRKLYTYFLCPSHWLNNDPMATLTCKLLPKGKWGEWVLGDNYFLVSLDSPKKKQVVVDKLQLEIMN